MSINSIKQSDRFYRHLAKLCLLIAIPLLLTTTLSSGVFAVPAQQDDASIYDDEFNGSQLNDRWTWLNEDPDSWTVNRLRGKLFIDATTGDMTQSCNNAQNVLLQDVPNGGFVITTKLEVELTEDFHQAGLVLMNSTSDGPDQDNYIKLDVGYSSFDDGTIAEFVWEEEGLLPDDGWWILKIEESEPAYLQLSYVDGIVTGAYSTDGESWETVGSEPFELDEDAVMGLYAVAGVFAYGDESTCAPEISDTRAGFDWFRVVADDVDADEETGNDAVDENVEEDVENDAEDDVEGDIEESNDSADQDESGSEGTYITRTLDDISYADSCTFDDRYLVDTVQIGGILYVGAYDVWADCDSGASQGVLMITPDNETVLYILLSAEMRDSDDVAAFEDALSEQLGQSVSFSEEATDDVAASPPTPEDTPTPEATSTPAPTSTPAATATAVPTATPEPTATRPQSVAVVLVATLNLRGGPGTNYNVVGSVPQNNTLTVTGQVEECGWLQVTAPSGETAWVSGGAQFVRLEGTCASIPVAQAPEPPAQPAGGSTGGSPNASQSCFLFINELGPEITITFTNRDDNTNNRTTKLPPDGQVTECYSPGRYTYTLDAPPPWGSTNGEVDLAPGDYFRFPISAR